MNHLPQTSWEAVSSTIVAHLLQALHIITLIATVYRQKGGMWDALILDVSLLTERMTGACQVRNCAFACVQNIP